ncbi:MAG: Sec63 [Trizodia sp. TS-e1964]|nr:MAG: Sec63 [Trizodia sp. TS-e1964]
MASDLNRFLIGAQPDGQYQRRLEEFSDFVGHAQLKPRPSEHFSPLQNAPVPKSPPFSSPFFSHPEQSQSFAEYEDFDHHLPGALVPPMASSQRWAPINSRPSQYLSSRMLRASSSQVFNGRPPAIPGSPHAETRQLSYSNYPFQETLSSSPSALISSPTTRLQLRPPVPKRRPIGHAHQAPCPSPKFQRFAFPHAHSTRQSSEIPLQQQYAESLDHPEPLQYSHPSSHFTPIVQGIQLVSTNQLPDRFRPIFPFPLFNAIQSKCFPAVYNSNDNIVLCSPTGSGKTAVLELAICRLLSELKTNQFKIVYQAPTKSLCAERQRDWQAKFRVFELQCAELTGDTTQGQLKDVQNASIIITTPEKWDSLTRKWGDHDKLMRLVKLFLIDEVHILKDQRGPTLEAVVSRMKTFGTDVRFLALSATVPNSADIASWLGKNSLTQHLPAYRETFGEEFRPVKLRKIVRGFQFSGNDFMFDKICDSKLPEIISKYCHKKPIMLYGIPKAPETGSGNLRQNNCCCASAGVAFHHAGLDIADRRSIEKAYLDGQINVICCTSTLAVGVNLPCHLVIIKNTVSWQGSGLKEYSDLEVMQMLGRAGRPQFDDSAVAVIITNATKVDRYEKMVSGEELLESCLHLNLIDHLNAEIGLGTVRNLESAKGWLAGTFLYVRLKENPNHYKLDGDVGGHNIDDRLEKICHKDIDLLQRENLITTDDKLKCTEFGLAMTRHYVKFESMKIFLALKEKSKMSEILTALTKAEEFKDIRLRATERALFKEINKSTEIKFPIKVDLALPQHKISLLIQAELGGVEFPAEEQFQKHRQQYALDKGVVFQTITRLARCIIDCKSVLLDSVSVRNGLELTRSLSSKVWDSSPLQLKQIEKLGTVAVRKLVVAGINNLEELEASEASRIESVLNRNPPFGKEILTSVKLFPKLRVSAKVVKKILDPSPQVKIQAEIGFLNDVTPLMFNRRLVYIYFLAESSDGRQLDFRKITAGKLANTDKISFLAELNYPEQYITCYIMCDEIVGTQRHAEIRPEIPAKFFPPRKRERIQERDARIRTSEAALSRNTTGPPRNEDFEDGIDDGDLLAAGKYTLVR